MAHKHKKGNENPTLQISPIGYFAKDPEPMPAWLNNHKAGTPVRIGDLWSSRVVYNPGAGFEGAPIHIFNAAHAAHVFVYVEYGFTKEFVDRELSDDAFRGYHLHHQQDVFPHEFAPRPLVYHLKGEELEAVATLYQQTKVPTNNAFALLKIYERNEDMPEEHGAWRFAVLYLGADAIATYDVLFGNTHCSPYACVADSYGFDGSYDGFSGGSLIEKIATRANRRPKYLLSPKSCRGWQGYRMLKSVSGSKYRFVWINENETTEK